jgi:hypothetical protein
MMLRKLRLSPRLSKNQENNKIRIGEKKPRNR